jgi:hypothetical protein
MDLLAFAKENIGADVTAKRHLNVLKDLQSMILLRQGALRATPRGMSLPDLAKAIAKERGPKLKTMLAEAERRQGPKVVDLLLMGIANPDADIAKLSEGLLTKNLKRQAGADLKTLLKHDRKEVRIGAAQAIGAKKLRYGAELIAFLQDADNEVRQAGRAALTQISGGVDYGPEPDASFGVRESAVEQWRDWWSRQK